MPIFSLHSDYGIGTLGKPCFDFLDFLDRCNASVWQTLPIGPTGYGDSPYQSFSAFAGNPYFLDPEWFVNKGWIQKSVAEAIKIPNTGSVDYGMLYENRPDFFDKVYKGFLRFAGGDDLADFNKFKKDNAYWLEDYTLFYALKTHYGGVGREDFLKFSAKSQNATDFANAFLAYQLEKQAFLQYAFDAQWREVKAYAKSKKILLIGDIPLYVSNDSADLWANPNLFCLDANHRPTAVAGVPPDMFSPDGQLWGNPLYNWDAHQASQYIWWKNRVKRMAELFDVIRIDHFIGICRYYSISSEATNAKNGIWLDGPKKGLTDALRSAAGKTRFIAEDLGVVTDEVKRLIKSCGFPGMAIMQFAFSGDDNINLPHNILKNRVVYTGTHDNKTLKEFFDTAPIKIRKNARRYLNLKRSKDLPEGVIRLCLASPADLAVIPLADYLGLGSEGRINTPSKPEGNWVWRINKPPVSMLADGIAALCGIYKREKRK